MSYKTILVVKNRAMGDSVMGLSTLQYIKELYPSAKIIYALPLWITRLYKNVDIASDEVISCDLKNAKDWLALFKKMRKIKPDVIFEMQQGGRTKKFFGTYSKIFGIPYFFHNHHISSGGNIHDQGVIKAVIQRDLDGAFSTLSHKERYPSYLHYTPKVSFSRKYKKRVILGVVATRQTKMWSLSKYVDLCKLIKRDFPCLNIVIPLSKSSGDMEISKELTALGISSIANLEYVELENLFEYIGNSKLYIGNDTGLKHIAIAAGIKSYTFFGPEPPNEWHPYNEKDHPYFYKEGLDCRTEHAHYCGLSVCESMICLNEFRPEDIYQVIKKDLDD
ncbi:glycosyltransferase family 9 protein [Halobacteriovorax sp. HLS]|uniref:glycosyltransferase family 9 protein n=1 Tax=Halobacteriovorax sp. HLS TaxID=2234000 RepID=UPI000FD8525B|nr:glycosyltransferase family 9 protein [Halobacteriovorax sp. HLS]